MTRKRRQPVTGADKPWTFPPPWLRQWERGWLSGDVTAGAVVAIMLVPQSLAYAMLAGLPPQAGLLASLLPLLAYAVFGSSSSLSVGPAAIASMMVAQALTPLMRPGSAGYILLAASLALGSGLLMLLMGWLRMGFLSQLLSRPVMQGFTLASAVLIVLGQIAPLVGWGSLGYTLPEMLRALMQHVQSTAAWHQADLTIGLVAMLLLGLGPLVVSWFSRRLGIAERASQVATRLWPLLVLVGTTLLANRLNVQSADHAALVGGVSLHADRFSQLFTTWALLPMVELSALVTPMLLIGMVSFVSSVAVAQAFALKHGERIDANRELLGLGLANVGAAVLGGLPVSGGLSRSVVNDAAGARSPLAGVITAAVLLALLWMLMPWMAMLPKAALAAIIIMAMINLLQLGPLLAAWRYDRAEAWAFISTAAGVLLIGFEAGILLGMAWSLGAMIWRHSHPHMAEVGRLPGSEHFRNVARYQVETLPGVLMMRIDESLNFTNVQRVEQQLCEQIHGHGNIDKIVLLLSAVNHIDHTAAQLLLELDAALTEQGKTLYLAEIKGPVMDKLKASDLAGRFAGRIYLSGQQAWEVLATAG